jgi:predicted flap endonuclease-1-like 5' DNA nuclease
MRMDYILYAVAILFFIATLASVAYSFEQEQVWVVSTAVIGLAFAGFGYTQRPKTETSSVTTKVSEPTPSTPQQQQQAIVVTPAPPQLPVTEPVKPEEATPIVEQLQTPRSMLTKVRGIGEKRTTQLNALGINSIEDLANASPKDLAAKMNISPKITRRWVENAKELGQKS